MIDKDKRGALRRAAGLALLAALLPWLLGGCDTLAQAGYLRQSVAGHLDIVWRARPLQEWIGAADTPPALRERLELARRMREFSVAVLKLPDGASYRRYAALDRPAALWNVVAAPELSLQLQTWCYPVVGCVGYRGYYARADADDFAVGLRSEGMEVAVYGVPAYSTLGRTEWLGGDPLLSTFIGWPEGELARLIFHELAHQVAYAEGDTGFNESFATAVERLGGARWLAQASAAARAEYAVFDARRSAFRALTRQARADLEKVYADPELDLAARRTAKAARLARLQDDYAAIKRDQWAGWSGYDRWFAQVNNASLAIQAAYDGQAEAFVRLFEREGCDFDRFFAAVRRLAALPAAERAATLAALPTGD